VRLAWLIVLAACHHGAAPVEGPSCVAAADHVLGLLAPGSPRAARIRDTFATRCENDGWGVEARACVVATTSLARPRHCKAMLTAEQRAALDRDLALVTATRVQLHLPPVCRDYGALLEKLGGCTAVPEGMRGALEGAYRQLTQSWQRGTSDIQALELQCRAMIDGLRQAGAARCGW
jgi:hypothetical protein